MANIFNVSLDYMVGIDKEQSVSVERLTQPQKDLIEMIVFELKDRSKSSDGLSERQQQILNGLMKEFSKK